MNLLGITKFLLGFFLAIVLLVGGGVATAFYLINRTPVPPPKPIFANDKAALKAKAQQLHSSNVNKNTPVFAMKKTSPAPTPSATVSPSPKPLESGAYKARVTWPQGLSMRSEPNLEAEKVGGVGFNEKIVVLEESADKTWQRVRLEDSEQQGWVKAGNTERIDEKEEQTQSQQ